MDASDRNTNFEVEYFFPPELNLKETAEKLRKSYIHIISDLGGITGPSVVAVEHCV